MKKTKIVCSIGPASSTPEVMSKMVEVGMNVARINFSHATDEEKEQVVNCVKEARKITGKAIGILYDTKGPEFRSGMLENGEITLVEGNQIKLVVKDVLGTEERFSVNHPQAIKNLKVGDIVLLENGLMSLTVEKTDEEGATCLITNGGVLGNKKSMSAPGVNLDIPFISEQDREDLIYASQHEGDFLALSFVSTAQDVLAARELCDAHGGQGMKMISKIENLTAIDNLDEIIAVSDGVMVARGDLGVEVPLATLPIHQKIIVEKCRKQGKFCIVATEMLESMKKNMRPTRAEVSDIAAAVLNGTDAVMLSGETTVGKYPVETVGYMASVCEAMEQQLDYKVNNENLATDMAGIIANSVVQAANLMDCKFIAATTTTGSTASKISNLRPKCLIIAPCPSEEVVRGLTLNFGVYGYKTNLKTTTDELIDDAKECALQHGADQEDTIIITGSFPNVGDKTTNFMKIAKLS